VVAVLLLAALYVGAAQFGFLAAPAHRVVSSVWPPAGLAVAALVLLGAGLWPGVALGALVANLTGGVPLAGAMVIAVGNTLEAVLAAWLLRRAGFRPSLERLRDVAALCGLGAVVSPVTSATLGVLGLWWSGTATGGLGTLWRAWWSGDAIGVLVVGATVLAWTEARRRLISPGRIAEAAAVLVVTGLLTAADLSSFGYVYPVFPVVLWAAYRLGPPGATAATLVATAVAVAFTVAETGPFATSTPTRNLFLLQDFVALLGLTALAFAAAIAERERAVQQLQASDERLAESQTAAHLGSWRWDVRADRVDWSDEMYRIYGLTRAAFPGTVAAFLALVHPDDRARVEATVRRAMADGLPFEFDERIVRPDGEVRTLRSQGRVRRDAGGAPVVLEGTCRDVTEARRAQQALAVSEAKFAKAFEASPVAMCLVTMPGGRLMDVNRRFVELLGARSRAELLENGFAGSPTWADPGERDFLLRTLVEQGSVREAPVTYRARDGVPRRAIVSLELIEVGGSPCGLALFWRA
jgi:PAS domain S-box-containing protein